MTLIERINNFIIAVASDIKSLYASKVNKTDIIAVAQGGTGGTTLANAQTALGIDKVVSANQRLTTKKQEFPNVFVDSNGQLQKTQLATWLDHAKMYNGLQPNGSFQMRDATGWNIDSSPLLSMDTTNYPFGANASLKCVGGQKVLLLLDKLPVNPFMKYRLSAMFKYEKVNQTPSLYAGITSLDVDGNFIGFNSAYHYGDTVTMLAQDLKIGDTKVHLTSLNGWNHSPESYQKGFKFYNYRDSRGYLYDPSIMTYSRYVTDNDGNGWWQSDLTSFSTTDNSIALSKPWDYANPQDPEGIWRAGTKIAQVTSGNTYTYNLKNWWMGGQTGVTQWEYSEVEMQGINTTSADIDTKFRPGTAYIAPLFLFNLGGESTGDITRLSNLYLEKI